MAHKCNSECTADWNPSRKCHCVTCGQNFTVIGNFDKHRKDGDCIEPAVCGLEYSQSRNLWHGPGEPDRFDAKT